MMTRVWRFLAALTACVVLRTGVDGNNNQAPKIVEAPRDTFELEGREAELRCRTIGKPPPKVQWKKNNHWLKWLNLCDSKDERLCIRPDGTLVIKDAIIQDSGEYSCRAKNHMGKVESETIYFGVQHRDSRPPQFLNGGPDDVNIRSSMLGGTVTVKCEAAGNGHLTFSWTKESGDKKLPEDRAYETEDHSLVIEHFETSDAGYYACTVTNEHGWTSKMISVSLVAEHSHVPTKPPPLTDPPLKITKFPEDQTVYVGDEVMFDCEIQGPIDTALLWYDGIVKADGPDQPGVLIGSRPDGEGEALLTKDRRFFIYENGTLSITNVTLKDDKRSFVCQGYSGTAGVISSSATLTVNVLPTKPSRPGLDSDASGLPTPSVRPPLVQIDGAPGQSPSNVEVEVKDDKGTVVVSWTPVAVADQNGGLSGYKIVYSCGNSGETTTEVPAHESSKEIRLKPGDNCTVSVWAYNDEGSMQSDNEAFIVESSSDDPFTKSTQFIIIVIILSITLIAIIIMVVACVVHHRRSDTMVVNKADLGQRPDPAGARTSIADMEEMVFNEGGNMSGTSTTRTPRGYFPAPPARPAPTPTLVSSTSMQQAMNCSTPITTELYYESKGSMGHLEYAYASEGPHLEDIAPPIPNRRPVFRPGNSRKGSFDLHEGMMTYGTDGHIDEAGFDPSDDTRRSIRSYELEYGKNGMPYRKGGREHPIPPKMNNSTLASRNLDVRPIGRQSEL